MKTSSFLMGVALGAAGVVWASRKRKGLMSVASGAGSMINFANLAKNKSNGTFNGMDSGSLANSIKSDSHSLNPAQKAEQKESSLKTIKDFIKGDPDVRREVELIMKETNTIIPGL
ncbi:hypothetical protein [Paenibacillus yonginensis]|nr:hypothetical protein [Paenibacillus yonginensis]